MKKYLIRRNVLGVVSLILCSVFVYFYTFSKNYISYEYSHIDLVTKSLYKTSKNMVTSIYLDYRIFDTLFETLLLLVAITAIFQFIQLETFEKKLNTLKKKDTYVPSTIRKYIISIIYPLLIVLGVYEVINGVNSPGGGFQGGAVLASVVMSRFLVSPSSEYDYNFTFMMEKIFFFFIIVFVSLHLFLNTNIISYEKYLLSLNILIGAKVAFGVSTIFLRFIYYEKE